MATRPDRGRAHQNNDGMTDRPAKPHYPPQYSSNAHRNYYAAARGQTVTANLKSKQLQLFAFSQQYEQP